MSAPTWIQRLLSFATRPIVIAFAILNYFTFRVFPEGFSSIHFFTPLNAKVSQMVEKFGLSDAGSYLRAAIELESINQLTPNQYWVINLWPPGMTLLNASLLRVAGDGPWLGVSLAVLIIFLWTSILTLAYIFARRALGTGFALILVVFIAFSPPITGWILDVGLFYAEGWSVGFFLLGLFALGVALSRVNQKNWNAGMSLAVIAGTSFAIAAYFRSPFYYIQLALVLTFLSCIAGWLVFRVARVPAKGSMAARQAAVVSTALVSMFLLMTPWLNFTEEQIRGERMWTTVGDGVGLAAWSKRSELPGFLGPDGGMGWACTIDPDRCERITGFINSDDGMALAIDSALKYPREFMVDRGIFLSRAWLSHDSGGVGAEYSLVPNLVFLIGLLAMGILVGTLAWRGQPGWLLWLFSGVFLTLPGVVNHIEVRYLIPLKLMIVTLPLIVSALRVTEEQMVRGGLSNPGGCRRPPNSDPVLWEGF